jgi:hypothetical protein
MAYNTDHLRTAGKVTVYTTFIGVVVFAFIFLLNLGTQDIATVGAQESATTTVTVVNTPPAWTADAYEVIESSTDNPTNAGDAVTWGAIGTDANAENYYLLICSTNATPTANSGDAPDCDVGATQWGVSTATISGTEATVATTTAASWAESNPWFAFICDENAITPRCNSTWKQGTNATNSSPFEVNHRPSFTVFTDDSPTDPGAVVTFMSTSSDSDTSGVADTVKLIVCATAGFNTATDSCTGTLLASSTVYAASDASATYTVVIPTQDQNYGAFGYVIDNHGFEASGGSQETDSTLTVANVAPTASSTATSINGGLDMTLTVEAGETTGFTLSFVTSDDNSCDAVGGGLGDEMVDYGLSLYRSGVGSTTCSVAAGSYNANNCYPSGVATTTWNLDCTANVATCIDNTDTDMEWDCTFPLWYIADPTDGTATSTQYSTEDWLAQVQGIDDDAATGALSEGTIGVQVNSFLAFALNTLSIPYGSLEPGQQNDPLVATTTVSATGNVGIDKDVTGESMCTTYTSSNPCPESASSTIPESEQRFATDTVAYTDATPISSTTPSFVDINVFKSTSTSTQATANAYWGIRIPGTITYAGDYTGENTFTVRLSSSTQWGP